MVHWEETKASAGKEHTMTFFENRVWRRWAKRFIPRNGWVYDQNNGVTIVVPTITYQAWLRSERERARFYSTGKIIRRMPLIWKNIPGQYSYPVEYFLFTNKPGYNYQSDGVMQRIDGGQAGMATEFSLFGQHFLLEQVGVDIPGARDTPSSIKAHSLLGPLQDPESFGQVVQHAHKMIDKAWRQYG